MPAASSGRYPIRPTCGWAGYGGSHRQAARSFAYRDKGIMATIGRRAAIAQFRHGLVLRGTLGWFAWFGLHLVYLVGFRNKLTVFVNWWWRYWNWTSGPRVIFNSESGVRRVFECSDMGVIQRGRFATEHSPGKT